MRLCDLTDAQILMLGARIAAGEKIFIEAAEDYCGIVEGSILELKDARVDKHFGIHTVTFYGRQQRRAQHEYINGGKFKLAAGATKAWSPLKPKVILAEPEAPRIFDGLGQEVNIGDILALKDESQLLFVRYDSYKGVNTLMFRDVRKGVDVKRMPGGLDRNHRTYTFDHSVKISDKATLDRILLNKLAA